MSDVLEAMSERIAVARAEEKAAYDAWKVSREVLPLWRDELWVKWLLCRATVTRAIQAYIAESQARNEMMRKEMGL